jgi:aminoglycoside phosphotransferase (APT) family kinase protein
VEAWIDAGLAGTRRRRTGPTEVHRVWSISAVLRVPTDGGELWFKACCDHFRAEAAILHRVARRLPDLVPVVVAVDDDRGWLLMEPLVGASDDDRAPGAPEALTPLWAAAQQASLGWLDELTDAGCPDRSVEPTLAAWRRVVATSPEMELLSAEERTALSSSTDEVEARVRELWSCGIPDTLSHGDLHLGNVAYDGSTLRLFDWTDACVSHPFLDAVHLAGFMQSDDGRSTLDVARAVTMPWRSAYPDADVDRALELAVLADLVFQSVTFAAIDAATEEGADDFTGTVAWLSRAVLREVGALPE